jgi:cytochrome c-type biogenesis protein CcmH/NrfG
MRNAKTIKNWDEKAKALADREQWDAAALTMKRAAFAAPHETARWKLVAEWQMRGGDLKAAIRTLEDGLKLNSNNAPAEQISLWLALAEAHLSAQNWELGAQACGEILRLDPRHHAALELLATAYLQTNDLESAVTVIEQLLAISPRDPLHRL